jgi:hypothetical protein
LQILAVCGVSVVEIKVVAPKKAHQE